MAAYLQAAGLKQGDVISKENAHILVQAFNLVRDDALMACREVANSYGDSPALAPGPYEERSARRAAALICLAAVNTKLEN